MNTLEPTIVICLVLVFLMSARLVGGTVYVWQDGCSKYWKGRVVSNAPTKYGKKQWYVEYENDTQLHVEKEEEMIGWRPWMDAED